MKVKIVKTTSETVEVELSLPTFRKEPNYFYKLYEKDGKLCYDYLFKLGDWQSYQHCYGGVSDKIVNLPEATIEEYASALAEFSETIDHDMENLYNNTPIESHSNL